jgi:hypothetical protein
MENRKVTNWRGKEGSELLRIAKAVFVKKAKLISAAKLLPDADSANQDKTIRSRIRLMPGFGWKMRFQAIEHQLFIAFLESF